MDSPKVSSFGETVIIHQIIYSRILYVVRNDNITAVLLPSNLEIRLHYEHNSDI